MTVNEILEKSTINENILKLPDFQIDKTLYAQVKKTILKLGGKWKGGKTFGFVFQEDPTELIQKTIGGANIDLKKDFQFFATPITIIKKMIELNPPLLEDTILEPHGGQGAIIKELNNITPQTIDTYELMPLNQKKLNESSLNLNLLGSNFLENKKTYDKIYANPPFSKNQDIEHIYKMFESLNNGGTLISIASSHWVNSNYKKETEFKEWLFSNNAYIEDLPLGSFNESGTGVATTLIKITK
jgi:hypothetical protein